MRAASGEGGGFSFDLELPPDTTAMVHLRIILRELTKGELGKRVGVWQANLVADRRQGAADLIAEAAEEKEATDLGYDLVLPISASE